MESDQNWIYRGQAGGGEGCMEKADRFQGLFWIQVGLE